MAIEDIVPFRGQRQMLALPWARPEIQSFSLVAGYGFGKSTTQDMILSDLANRYWQHDVKVALFSNTIALLKKTVVADFVKWLIQSGSTYHYDRAQNVITIGRMTFFLLASGRPEDIYGTNVHVSLSDEMDELEQTKCIEAHRAIQERTRLVLPDGRKPFSVFTTTAQGFKGTYQIIEEYKETGTPYALVRGKTRDNTALDPSYVDRLYALYNENERLAFLEGHFVNLTSGKVYPGYDESRHLVEPFDIHQDETIHIGQDLNLGYSKALAFIIRNRNLYAVKEWSFEDIGRAPERFRQDFPANPILWYPDNSGKAILGGYVEAADAYRVEIVWTGRNPAILDRTFAVNLAFRSNRLHVFKTLKQWPMALKTRGYDKKGVAEKGTGPSAPDHICFIGSTLIATDKGMVPIRDIRKGDMILTRKGYRRAEAAFCSGIKEVRRYNLAGRQLVATEDHPVFTMNRGFVPISDLRPRDTLVTLLVAPHNDKGRPETEKTTLRTEVESWARPYPVPVYNLTIEGEHEYFANNVLVSNCDAGEYATFWIIANQEEFADLYELTPAARKDNED